MGLLLFLLKLLDDVKFVVGEINVIGLLQIFVGVVVLNIHPILEIDLVIDHDLSVQDPRLRSLQIDQDS